MVSEIHWALPAGVRIPSVSLRAVTDRVTWRQREPVGRPWLHEHRHKMCTSAQHADDTVPERLRGWTRNPLGSARRGSNPLGVAIERTYVQCVVSAHPTNVSAASRRGVLPCYLYYREPVRPSLWLALHH